MSPIKIRFKLNVTNLRTKRTKIIPLPRNKNIFELLGGEMNEILIVNKKGKVKPAIAFITVVDVNGAELV